MARRQRYVAEGFVEDVTKLMNDFLELKSLEFRDFASAWKKNYFSLIFMGRPDDTETDEFVNEMYRITCQYLLTESFNQQVGAVYILYGLFRNQISEPSIKIRIELRHWKVINSLRDEAIEKKYLSLHYVIDFLMDHAFHYVLRQTLRGPFTALSARSESDVIVSDQKRNFKVALEKYVATNKLATLRDLQLEYVKEKKKIDDNSDNLQLNMSADVYEEAISELEALVSGQKYNEERNAGEKSSNSKKATEIATLKEKSCRRQCGLSGEKEMDGAPGSSIKHEPGNQRSSKGKKEVHRKEDRRVGRPRKMPQKETSPESSEDDDGSIDISHLLKQQKHFYLPPKNDPPRKARTKRDPYYELHPSEKKAIDKMKSDSDD